MWGSLVTFWFISTLRHVERPRKQAHRQTYGTGAVWVRRAPDISRGCGHANKGHILCLIIVVSRCQSSADVGDGPDSGIREKKERNPGLPV